MIAGCGINKTERWEKGKKEIMYRPFSIFSLYNYVLCAYERYSSVLLS